MKITRSVIKSASLTLFAYAVIQCLGIGAPFLHGDDQQQLVFVNGLDAWWKFLGADYFGLWRPFKNLLFLFFSWLSGFGMPFCRAVAILIGILSFFPVRAFFRRVLGHEGSALLASAIWLLSPTLVSSASWLSCVNIQLMCGFAALTFVFHIDEKPARAALCLVLTCLSYELGVCVGPALVAYDFFFRSDRLKTGRGWRVIVLYAAFTVVYLVCRSVIGCAGEVNGSFVGCSRLDLMLASAYFTCLHFYTWFFPFGRMAVFGSYTNGTVSLVFLLACWGVLLALAASALAVRKRMPAYSFGVALAGIGFLPVGNFLGLANGPYGDYYLGLSSMGFAVAAVAVCGRVFVARGLPRLALLAFGTIFLFSRLLGVAEAAAWVRDWTDPVRAARANVRTFPDAYYAHVVLARVFCDRGLYDAALQECDAADRLTGADSEKASSSYLVRAICALVGSRDAQVALFWLNRAEAVDEKLRVDDGCAFYRGCVQEDLLGDNRRAEEEYARAIPIDRSKWNADLVACVNRYARLLALRGDLKGAIAYWTDAARLAPADAEVAQNLRMAKALLKR